MNRKLNYFLLIAAGLMAMMHAPYVVAKSEHLFLSDTENSESDETDRLSDLEGLDDILFNQFYTSDLEFLDHEDMLEEKYLKDHQKYDEKKRKCEVEEVHVIGKIPRVNNEPIASSSKHVNMAVNDEERVSEAEIVKYMISKLKRSKELEKEQLLKYAKVQGELKILLSMEHLETDIETSEDEFYDELDRQEKFDHSEIEDQSLKDRIILTLQKGKMKYEDIAHTYGVSLNQIIDLGSQVGVLREAFRVEEILNTSNLALIVAEEHKKEQILCALAERELSYTEISKLYGVGIFKIMKWKRELGIDTIKNSLNEETIPIVNEKGVDVGYIKQSEYPDVAQIISFYGCEPEHRILGNQMWKYVLIKKDGTYEEKVGLFSIIQK